MALANKAQSSRKPSRSAAAAILAVCALLVTSTCAHRGRPRATASRRPPPGAGPGAVVQGETGIASWYGHPYHGRRTANGEIYNMYELTAAHRTLPFNTQVRVHNLKNGRDVQVRINDRGPFVEGRIIDLSYAAAQAMGMPSTALVRLEILGASTSGGEAGAPALFVVQVGAFEDRENAERLKATLAPRYGPVTIQTFDRGDGVFHRVRVGRESSEDGARALAQQLVQAGFAAQTFIVRLN